MQPSYTKSQHHKNNAKFVRSTPVADARNATFVFVVTRILFALNYIIDRFKYVVIVMRDVIKNKQKITFSISQFCVICQALVNFMVFHIR